MRVKQAEEQAVQEDKPDARLRDEPNERLKYDKGLKRESKFWKPNLLNFLP